MKSYLIIIELNTTGYIIGTEETLVEAEIRVDKMCNESTIYSFHDLEKYHSHLKEYKSYSINGNLNNIEKVKQQLTNGILSYYILEIDEKTFSFEQFIRERENCSNIYDMDGMEKLYELFDDKMINMKAN
jgi:hypothetical protein